MLYRFKATSSSVWPGLDQKNIIRSAIFLGVDIA